MIISIANLKGGVGKTTTAINLGAGLAQEGYKVLLIDTDAQANLTESFGLNLPNQYQDYLLNYYQAYRDHKDLNPDPRSIGENLYLIPANIDLALADAMFSTVGKPNEMMKIVLEELKQDFDITIIDCPPSMGILTRNALTVSDYVIIPTLAEYLPTRGIKLFIDACTRFIVKERLNKDLQIGGILINQYNPNPILSRDLEQALKDNFPKELLQTRIRRNIAISEAQASGEPIYTYAPDSNGAKDYTELTKEIIKRFT